MDLDATLAFVAVARSSSFTRAAAHLGVPKATVSRRVARLEARLATRLLERTTRRLSLTQSGRAYFERCASGIEAIESAERAIGDLSGRVAGKLRITMPNEFARTHIVPLLPALHRKHPELTLELELTQRRVDLVAEGFDLALRGGGALEESGYVARKLLPSELGLFASVGYLKRHRAPSTIADLAVHQLITVGTARWKLAGPDGVVETPLHTAWLAANDFGFSLAAILANLGIGLMDVNMIAAELRARRVRRVLPAYGLGGGGLWALYPSSRHLSPKVRAMIDFLVEHLPQVGGQRPRGAAR